MTKYDVFISSKSEDYRIANDVYNFLASNDVKVFFADAQLKELGTSEYSDVIDNVIDSVKHMIVVGSKIEYIESKWVKTEWRAFTDEIRAGRKSGNIITILDGLSPAELPLVSASACIRRPSPDSSSVTSHTPQRFCRRSCKAVYL